MSVTTRIVEPVENDWDDAAAEPGDDDARAGRCSPRICSGANRALANFGGGNTSAKGTGHRPRRPRDRGDLGQGLRQRPRDDGRARLHAAAARRGAAAVRARRDDRRGDGRPPRRAARSTRRRRGPRSRRCCTPSSPPRTSTTPTRTRSTCSPARATASELIAECFGDAAAWIDYIRPGLHAGQAGRRGACASNPTLRAGRARQARPRRLGRHRARRPTSGRSRSCNQAAEFVNARAARRRALRRPGARRARLDADARAATLHADPADAARRASRASARRSCS